MTETIPTPPNPPPTVVVLMPGSVQRASQVGAGRGVTRNRFDCSRGQSHSKWPTGVACFPAHKRAAPFFDVFTSSFNFFKDERLHLLSAISFYNLWLQVPPLLNYLGPVLYGGSAKHLKHMQMLRIPKLFIRSACWRVDLKR